MQTISILGATGSVGEASLEVLAINSEDFQIEALSCDANWQKMLGLCQKYAPKTAICADLRAAEKLARALKKEPCDRLFEVEVKGGAAAVVEAAASPKTDLVVVAIAGEPSLKAKLCSRQSRQDPVDGQQGVPGQRRRTLAGRSQSRLWVDNSARQRAQRNISVLRRELVSQIWSNANTQNNPASFGRAFFARTARPVWRHPKDSF